MEGVFVTREDLEGFRIKLLHDFHLLLLSVVGEPDHSSGQTLRTREVRKMLKISAGTLQKYRIEGVLRAKKVRGAYYWDKRDLQKFLQK